MKKLEKMSLANVTSKLTRKEMSNIMAGSGGMGFNSCVMWCSHQPYSLGCSYFGGSWYCEVSRSVG